MTGRLAIDIGNTRIACGFFQNGELRETQFHLLSELEEAGREIARFASERQIRSAALSSVVPTAQDMLTHDLQRKDALKIFLITSDSQPLLSNVYRGLGADRIANATAGYKRYAREKPVLVFDFGSATTLTAVSPEGEFLGGWITLGLGKTLATLHQGIALLPDVQDKLDETTSLGLGMNAKDAIIRGCLLGHAGAVESWIDAAKKDLGSDAFVVATGGHSTKMGSLCERIDEVDPLLTLKGIELIAEAAMGPADRV